MLSLALVEFPSERNKRFVVNISDIKHFSPKTVDDFDKTKLYKVRWPNAKSFDSKSPASSQFYEATIILLAASEKSLVDRAKIRNERLPRGFRESVMRSQSQPAPDVVDMAHKTSKRTQRQVEMALEISCRDRIQKVLQANQAGNVIPSEPTSGLHIEDITDKKKAHSNVVRKIDFASPTSKEKQAPGPGNTKAIAHVTPTKRAASSPQESGDSKVICLSQSVDQQADNFEMGSLLKSPSNFQSESSKTLGTATSSKPTEAERDSESVPILNKSPTKKGNENNRKKHSPRKLSSPLKFQSESSNTQGTATSSKPIEAERDSKSVPTVKKSPTKKGSKKHKKKHSPRKLSPPFKFQSESCQTLVTAGSKPEPTGNVSESAASGSDSDSGSDSESSTTFVESLKQTPTKEAKMKKLSPYKPNFSPFNVQSMPSKPLTLGISISEPGSDSGSDDSKLSSIKTTTEEENRKQLTPRKLHSSPLKSANLSLGKVKCSPMVKHHSFKKDKKSKNEQDVDTDIESCSYESSADQIATLKDELLEVQQNLNTERKAVHVLKCNLAQLETTFSKLKNLTLEMTGILEGCDEESNNHPTIDVKDSPNLKLNNFEVKIMNKSSNTDQKKISVQKKSSCKNPIKKGNVKKESSTRDVSESAKGHEIIGKMIYDAIKGDVPLQSDGKGKVHLGNNVWIKEVAWAKMITSSKSLSILVQNLAEIIWGWKQCAVYSLTGGISPKTPNAAAKRSAPAGAVQAILGFYRAKLMIQGVNIPEILDQNVEKVGKGYLRSKFQNAAKKWAREQAKAEEFADSKEQQGEVAAE